MVHSPLENVTIEKKICRYRTQNFQQFSQKYVIIKRKKQQKFFFKFVSNEKFGKSRIAIPCGSEWTRPLHVLAMSSTHCRRVQALISGYAICILHSHYTLEL